MTIEPAAQINPYHSKFMKKFLVQSTFGFVSLALLVLFSLTCPAQTIITNYTFDTSASATPPAWGVWPNGVGAYITNAWSSSDVTNNPNSGSLLITSTFTGANQQSVVWSGQNGDYNPPLIGSLITNFSCYIRFDPSSPTNSTTASFGSLAFYLNTLTHGAYPPTQVGGYYSVPANNTNWVFFSVPVNTSANVYGITIQLETYGNALTGTSKMYLDDVQLSGPIIVSNPPISGVSIVDWNNVHQRIDGFGASSAWNGSWTTAEADLLFSTNNNVTYQSQTYNGIGLSLLRNHILYCNTTLASDTPTTVETSIMQMAQARGAKVWSTPWTPAAGFKSTNDIYDAGTSTNGINGGSYLGSGNNITNINYASQLANYVVSMKNSYGVNIYALSVQNEPDADVLGYESCQWNGAQIHDFVTNLSSAFAAQGVSSTKIIIPESENWSSDTALYTPTLSDPNSAADVSIIANHNYVGNNNVGDQTTPPTLSVSGKTLWETEVALLSGSDSSIANGVYYAQRIYLFMTQAQANAYHYWWLVSGGGGGNEGLLDGSAAVTKRLFTFGQYSRFVRPNYYRINATSSQVSSLISAYKDSASTAFAIVVVNTNVATGVIQTFNLANFTAGSVTPWITSISQSLAPQTPVTVTNGSFTYLVPAMSVVTFVGQGNTPPTIAPVPNQTVNPGVTVLVTNTASDSDLPAQTLTFGAANTFPANATINGASGVFSWRPPVSAANTTNPIQIKVADTGSPNLSATNNFSVIVNAITNPVISSASLSPGQVSLTVNGPQGPDYTVLTSSNLTSWQALFTTNSPAMPFTFIGTNLNNPDQFYRFQIGP
jgi:glucuronoarabinoxylan endo-1,4-beta-xylanase